MATPNTRQRKNSFFSSRQVDNSPPHTFVYDPNVSIIENDENIPPTNIIITSKTPYNTPMKSTATVAYNTSNINNNNMNNGNYNLTSPRVQKIIDFGVQLKSKFKKPFGEVRSSEPFIERTSSTVTSNTTITNNNNNNTREQAVDSVTTPRKTIVGFLEEEEEVLMQQQQQDSPNYVSVQWNVNDYTTSLNQEVIPKRVLKVYNDKLVDKTTVDNNNESDNDNNNEEEEEESVQDIHSLSNHLNSCFLDKTYSDFVILCGPGLVSKFYAHCVILSSRSLFFKNLLKSLQNNNNTQNSNLLKRKERLCYERMDLNPEIFNQVLNYIYTGKINFNLQNILDIFIQSEEFKIPCLKQLCENYLMKITDIVNAPLLLEMSMDLNANELKKHLLSFIDKNIKLILQKSEYLFNLKMSTFITIIERDSLQLNPLEEVMIFEAFTKWYHCKKEQQLNNNENDQEELKRQVNLIIQHIRYPLMNSEQLVSVVEPTNLVPQHPLLFEAYKHHLVPNKNMNEARFRNRAGSEMKNTSGDDNNNNEEEQDEAVEQQ
ncbi:hypothetical protein ABK040_014008 [Willaertia magna]